MSKWSQFAQQHWVIGGILASVLWFLAGRQSLTNRQRGYALFWRGIALFIVTVVCVWAVLGREWIGLAFGITVLCIEAFSIKRGHATRHSKH